MTAQSNVWKKILILPKSRIGLSVAHPIPTLITIVLCFKRKLQLEV